MKLRCGQQTKKEINNKHTHAHTHTNTHTHTYTHLVTHTHSLSHRNTFVKDQMSTLRLEETLFGETLRLAFRLVRNAVGVLMQIVGKVKGSGRESLTAAYYGLKGAF